MLKSANLLSSQSISPNPGVNHLEFEVKAELKSLVDGSTVQVQVIGKGSGMYDGTTLQSYVVITT